MGNTVNGDKSVGEATKETSSSVTGLGQTTQQTTSAIGTATNAIGSWVSGLFDSTEAKDAETKAVKDSIFSDAEPQLCYRRTVVLAALQRLELMLPALVISG